MIALVCILFGSQLGRAQSVSIDYRLPSEITAGQETEVVLLLKKGNLEGFARFQQTFPDGVDVRAGESAFADFAFDGGKLNLIWLKLPAEPEIRVSYLIKADPRVKGEFSLGGKFSYLVENNRNDLELESRKVRILPAPGADPAALMDIAGFRASAVQAQPVGAVSQAAESFNAYRQTPEALPSGKGYAVKVLLEKGNWDKSGILEEDILNQFEARPLETLGARFSFEAGKARFVWLKMPAEPCLVVSYELVPRLSGQNPQPSIQGKFSLIEGNNSRQVMVSQRAFTLASTQREELAAVAASLRLDPESSGPVPKPLPAGTRQSDASGTATGRQTASTTQSPSAAPAQEVRGVVFRVQVGAFQNPVDIRTYFRKMNVQEEVMVDRHGGLYKYTVGNYIRYEEARAARDRLARTTLVDESFVCAFRDGVRISVDEALRLTRQRWSK